MSAEGHLTNPALFADLHPPVWQMASEYLDLVDKYPCPLSYARGHLFKLFHHVLQIKTNANIREIIAKGQTLAKFRQATELIKNLYSNQNLENWQNPEELEIFNLKFPPWLCQPYVRPPPEEHLKKMAEIQEKQNKRKPEEPENMGGLSKRKMKKLGRNPHKKFPHERENCKLCVSCPNPCGNKCIYQMCRQCCRAKCFNEELDCVGHKVFVKTNREKARNHANKNTV